MRRQRVAGLLLALSPLGVGAGALCAQEAPRFVIEMSSRGVDVVVNGSDFTTVWLRHDGHVPYLFPVLLEDGVEMTRAWPMEERDHEEQDHPHHRSLWFAHGDVNGHDFWTGRDGSRIRVAEIVGASGGAEGQLELDCDWIAPDGSKIATDRRKLTFQASSGEAENAWRAIEIDLELRAREPLVFGDTKEGTMAVRLAPKLRLSGEVANAKARNSEGVEGAEIWGKRARWVHYEGTLEGAPRGVLILDHPNNLRHPTWWHARAYGLFAANPFGIHDFEEAEDGSGDLELAEDATLRLRYKIVFHTGALAAEAIEDFAQSYATP